MKTSDAPALKTRKPTGQASWPQILLAGAEKCGKSYAAFAFSASDMIDRTFVVEIGEGDADLYGAIPGVRYEIVEHDGTYRSIARAIHAATLAPRENGKPHAIVIDSMTELWDLLANEQQERANNLPKNKGKPGDAQITMDMWNAAKKRWRPIVDLLRKYDGPVIYTARLDEVTVVGADGRPTSDKTWKIRAEKNLGFDVSAIVRIPAPQDYRITGVRSLTLQVPPGRDLPVPDFTVEKLIQRMGIDPARTAPRSYTPPQPEVTADEQTSPAPAQSIQNAYKKAADALINRARSAKTSAEVREIWHQANAQFEDDTEVVGRIAEIGRALAAQEEAAAEKDIPVAQAENAPVLVGGAA